MSLERKDIRAKLDTDVHEALVKICERDSVDIGAFIEREIERCVMTELQRYILSRRKFDGLEIIDRLRETV